MPPADDVSLRSAEEPNLASGRGDRRRVVLLLPSESYRTDFVAAATEVGADVVIVSNARQAWAGDATAQGRTLVVDFSNEATAVDLIAELADRHGIDAVIATDERGVRIAARASQRLGLRSIDPSAADISTDKVLMRRTLGAHYVAQPRFAVGTPAAPLSASSAGLARLGPFPLVVKPTRRSGSQGVIRVDDEMELAAAFERISPLLCDGEVLVEEFVPGVEVAVEGLVRSGHLEVLAVFDKPDPLDGPFFAETMYVTPSRLDPHVIKVVCEHTRAAVTAIGVSDGPIHAELRIRLGGPDGWSGPFVGGPWLIEVAARTIGGLCSRMLRFGLGVSLEQLVVRHALGMAIPPLTTRRGASGVLMIPVEVGGIFRGIDGLDEVRAVPGIVDVELSVAPGTPVLALPEGDRYVGFVFARGVEPADVERALRTARSILRIRVGADD